MESSSGNINLNFPFPRFSFVRQTDEQWQSEERKNVDSYSSWREKTDLFRVNSVKRCDDWSFHDITHNTKAKTKRSPCWRNFSRHFFYLSNCRFDVWFSRSVSNFTEWKQLPYGYRQFRDFIYLFTTPFCFGSDTPLMRIVLFWKHNEIRANAAWVHTSCSWNFTAMRMLEAYAWLVRKSRNNSQTESM